MREEQTSSGVCSCGCFAKSIGVGDWACWQHMRLRLQWTIEPGSASQPLQRRGQRPLQTTESLHSSTGTLWRRRTTPCRCQH